MGYGTGSSSCSSIAIGSGQVLFFQRHGGFSIHNKRQSYCGGGAKTEIVFGSTNGLPDTGASVWGSYGNSEVPCAFDRSKRKITCYAPENHHDSSVSLYYQFSQKWHRVLESFQYVGYGSCSVSIPEYTIAVPGLTTVIITSTCDLSTPTPYCDFSTHNSGFHKVLGSISSNGKTVTCRSSAHDLGEVGEVQLTFRQTEFSGCSLTTPQSISFVKVQYLEGPCQPIHPVYLKFKTLPDEGKEMDPHCRFGNKVVPARRTQQDKWVGYSCDPPMYTGGATVVEFRFDFRNRDPEPLLGHYTYHIPSIAQVTGMQPNAKSILHVEGNDFGEDNNTNLSVFVDGEKCDINWSTASAIECTLPIALSQCTGTVFVSAGACESSNYTIIPEAPEIVSFAPQNGSVGDYVTCVGRHFGFGNNCLLKASFAGVESSDVVRLNTTAFVARIPYVNNATSLPVAATVASVPSKPPAAGSFLLLPKLTRVVCFDIPTSGGGSVTLEGDFFGWNGSNIELQLTNANCSCVTGFVNQTVLGCSLGPCCGAMEVRVVRNGLSSLNSGFLSAHSPLAVNVGPPGGSRGSIVDIGGTDFGVDGICGLPKVYFDDEMSTSIVRISASELYATLPNGYGVTRIRIEVEGLHNTDQGLDYTFPAPKISSSSLDAGGLLTLAGEQFGKCEGVPVFYRIDVALSLADGEPLSDAVADEIVCYPIDCTPKYLQCRFENSSAFYATSTSVVVSCDGLISKAQSVSFVPPQLVGVIGDPPTRYGDKIYFAGSGFGSNSTSNEFLMIWTDIDGSTDRVSCTRINSSTVATFLPPGHGRRRVKACLREVCSSEIHYTYPNPGLVGFVVQPSTDGGLISVKGSFFGKEASSLVLEYRERYSVHSLTAKSLAKELYEEVATFDAPPSCGHICGTLQLGDAESNQICTPMTPTLTGIDCEPCIWQGHTISIHGKNLGSTRAAIEPSVTVGGRVAQVLNATSSTLFVTSPLILGQASVRVSVCGAAYAAQLDSVYACAPTIESSLGALSTATAGVIEMYSNYLADSSSISNTTVSLSGQGCRTLTGNSTYLKVNCSASGCGSADLLVTQQGTVGYTTSSTHTVFYTKPLITGAEGLLPTNVTATSEDSNITLYGSNFGTSDLCVAARIYIDPNNMPVAAIDRTYIILHNHDKVVFSLDIEVVGSPSVRFVASERESNTYSSPEWRSRYPRITAIKAQDGRSLCRTEYITRSIVNLVVSDLGSQTRVCDTVVTVTGCSECDFEQLNPSSLQLANGVLSLDVSRGLGTKLDVQVCSGKDKANCGKSQFGFFAPTLIGCDAVSLSQKEVRGKILYLTGSNFAPSGLNATLIHITQCCGGNHTYSVNTSSTFHPRESQYTHSVSVPLKYACLDRGFIVLDVEVAGQRGIGSAITIRVEKVYSVWMYAGLGALLSFLVVIFCFLQRSLVAKRLEKNLGSRSSSNSRSRSDGEMSDVLTVSDDQGLDEFVSLLQDKGVRLIPSQQLAKGKRIGAGGFAAVFKGKWRRTTVALKEIRLEALANMRSFVNEIQIHSLLRHPNILMVYGIARDRSTPTFYLVMEYMKRGSLRDYLDRARKTSSLPSIREKYRLCIEIAKGMEHLHGLKIIHRDLKSLNVLIDSHGCCKVCDFGLSRNTVSSVMTVCGTPIWITPEVLRGSNYTAAADVYSFAIVMWEVFSNGEVPYANRRLLDVQIRVCAEGLRPTITPAIPAEIADLLEVCWAQTVENRPAFETLVFTLEQLRKRSNRTENSRSRGQGGVRGVVGRRAASEVYSTHVNPLHTPSISATSSSSFAHGAKEDAAAVDSSYALLGNVLKGALREQDERS